jgi:hypothetical protein
MPWPTIPRPIIPWPIIIEPGWDGWACCVEAALKTSSARANVSHSLGVFISRLDGTGCSPMLSASLGKCPEADPSDRTAGPAGMTLIDARSFPWLSRDFETSRAQNRSRGGRFR